MNTISNNPKKQSSAAISKSHSGSSNTKMMIMAAVFAALTAVCSQIQIPLAPVPINLATFAIFITAGLLGKRWGTVSLIVYVLLGAVGLPVFAGFTGGFGIITGPTGGYIIGYIFTAFITGYLIEFFSRKKTPAIIPECSVNEAGGAPSYPLLALAMAAGLAVCYLLGTIWFIYLTGWTLGKALMSCVIVFLPGDALKIIAACILVKRLWPAAHRFRTGS